MKAYSYIRFSSEKQAQGNSLERQLQAAQKYADEHNLILIDDLRDEGVSGYTGKNVTEGALGEFLALVQAGKIEPGSVLIVESLDRLSRKKIRPALNQLSVIVEHGIDVVTLSDGQRYSEESLDDLGSLIISLSIMARAHEESEMKSKRIKAAWKNKRDKAQYGIPISNRCPLWLKVVDGKYELTEKAEDIQRMYQLHLEGYGIGKIVQKFKGKYSHAQISGTMSANNRTVIGEYQPKIRENGNKVIAGDPIKNYYPAIISEEVFYMVQKEKACKSKRSGPSSKYINLFTSICKCSLCGGSMVTVYKGSKGQEGYKKRYLACSNSRKKLCRYKSVPLYMFEESFLKFFQELDIHQILRSDATKETEKQQIEHQIKELEGLEFGLNKKIDNLTNAIIESSSDTIRSKFTTLIDEAQNELNSTLNTIKQHRSTLKQLETEKFAMKDHLAKLQELSQHIEDLDTRIKLRGKIKDLISEIVIYAHGLQDQEFSITPEGIKLQKSGELQQLETLEAVGLNGLQNLEPYGLNEHDPKKVRKLEGKLLAEAKKKLDAYIKANKDQFYVVKFKNGNERIVTMKDGMISERIGNHVDMGEVELNGIKTKFEFDVKEGSIGTLPLATTHLADL